MSIKKLIKDYYVSELERIEWPEPPFNIEKGENKVLGFVLSFALSAVSILFIITGVYAEPSRLSETVAVFSEKNKLDKAIYNSLLSYKTGWNLISKEE